MGLRGDQGELFARFILKDLTAKGSAGQDLIAIFVCGLAIIDLRVSIGGEDIHQFLIFSSAFESGEHADELS